MYVPVHRTFNHKIQLVTHIGGYVNKEMVVLVRVRLSLSDSNMEDRELAAQE